ncbi:MAG: VOC family protein [Gammaproteobacteria bacterium]|nr:VOC family protein [Gammaproteobacteria bacterium]
MLKKVHHINFLVSDLDEAVSRYRSVFGVEPGEIEHLPERGVKVARFRLDNVWIILVQPTDPDRLPAKHLASEGDGFFLISFEVDDIERAAASVKNRGCGVLDETPRHGLDDWKVVDIDPRDTFGVRFQLVESGDS